MFFERYRRQMDVKTTLCAYWVWDEQNYFAPMVSAFGEISLYHGSNNYYVVGL